MKTSRVITFPDFKKHQCVVSVVTLADRLLVHSYTIPEAFCCDPTALIHFGSIWERAFPDFESHILPVHGEVTPLSCYLAAQYLLESTSQQPDLWLEDRLSRVGQ